MTLHHDKHHQAYVDNLNKEVADEKLKGKASKILALCPNIRLPRATTAAVWNHSFFGASCAGQIEPSAELSAASENFGSMDDFKRNSKKRGQAVRLRWSG